MARKLTNKQLLVLEVVRRNPAGIDANTIASTIEQESPLIECRFCDGAGERNDHRCSACKGTGERHLYFGYGAAYQALQRLREDGLVGRRCKRDEWGDEIPVHVYFPEAAPDPTDPLERAFNAPSAQVES